MKYLNIMIKNNMKNVELIEEEIDEYLNRFESRDLVKKYLNGEGIS